MSTPRTSIFKRGDTFSLNCTYKYNGSAQAITNETFAAQVRDVDDRLIVTLVCTPDANQVANPGKFAVTMPAGVTTASWPVDDLYCDIEVLQAGVRRSTETFIIPVVADVTRV